MFQDYYLLFKTLHIIGFTAWFSGLFYLVRMFVYHVETKNLPKEHQAFMAGQYGLMQERVYKIICNPAMMITWTFGLLMILNNGVAWFAANYWLHAKLFLLVLLTAYHLWCKRISLQLRSGYEPYSGFQFRLINEIPTLFLVLIVLLAVYKNSLNWIYTAIGLLVFAGLMYRGAVAYRKRRENSNT